MVYRKSLPTGMLDGLLSDWMADRKKRGFTLPFEHWMRQELQPEIQQVLTAQRVNEGPLGGLLNGVEVEKVWRSFLDRIHMLVASMVAIRTAEMVRAAFGCQQLLERVTAGLVAEI